MSSTTEPTPHRAPPLARVFGAAAPIVAGVLNGHTPESALSRLDDALRPAVMDCVFATLRDFGRGDFFLSHLLAKPLKEKGLPQIRALLLLAINRLERRPDDAHITVDQAVVAVTTMSDGRYKSLINAVLRNFLRQHAALTEAAQANDCAHWRHPDWWIARVRHDHPDDWTRILDAGNTHPPMSLRANNRRITSADLAKMLDAAGIAYFPPAEAAANTPPGALTLTHALPVARLPGFAQGDCSVQDAGAQHAARLLDVREGMRVLDACAAPGGKTAHILEQHNVTLLALDADATRAQRIQTNLERLGLVAQIAVADVRGQKRWWDGRLFDRILADVPCSASGVVRRHADAKWLRRENDIAGFAKTQAQIIDALWPILAPGGKMLYATCSVFDQENSQQVAHFLARHPDAALAEPELRLLPDDRHDGFFYALLHKR
jgi:16S rRNA (cytosine967-C5)-methyltransferase